MTGFQADFVISMAVVTTVAAVIILLLHRFKEPLALDRLVVGTTPSPGITGSGTASDRFVRVHQLQSGAGLGEMIEDVDAVAGGGR